MKATTEEKEERLGERGRREGREEAKQGRVWVRKTVEYSKSPVRSYKPALHTYRER